MICNENFIKGSFVRNRGNVTGVTGNFLVKGFSGVEWGSVGKGEVNNKTPCR